MRKRIVSAALLLIVLALLTACGGNPSETGQETSAAQTDATEPAAEQSTEETAAPSDTDPLDALVGKPLSEVDPELLQDIIVQTALAYYYKNPYCQYNMTTNLTAQGVSGARLDTQGIDPEFITEDEPFYSHCRSFCSEVYESAFGWDKLPSVRAGWTTKFNTYHQMIVMQYSYNPKDIRGLPKEETYTDLSLFLKDFEAALQPGDIMYGEKKAVVDGGHVMIYLGDCFGDGKRWCLHSWPVGGGIMPETGSSKGVNKREPEGAITLQTLDDLVLSKTTGASYPNWSFAAMNGSGKPNQCYIWLIRPMLYQEFMDSTVVTEENVARLRYPYMSISRDIGKYATDTLITGEELDVSVTVESRNRKSAFAQVEVAEPLPEGAELIAGSLSEGGVQEGNILRWTVDVPAGKAVTVSYRLRVTAKAGETVKLPGGTVSGIDTKSWELKVAKTALTAAQRARLIRIAAGDIPKSLLELQADGYLDLDLVNQFYSRIIGLETAFPKTVEEYVSSFMKVGSPKSVDTVFLMEKPELNAQEAEYRFAAISRNIGGYHVYMPNTLSNTDRQLEHLEQFYEPGDVFLINDASVASLVLSSPETRTILIYLGAGKLLQYTKDKQLRIVSWRDSIERAILNSMVIGIRPTLIFDKAVTPEEESGWTNEVRNLAREASVTTTYPAVNENVYPLSMINDGVGGVGKNMCALQFDRAGGQILFDLGRVCEISEYRLFGYEYAKLYSLVTGWTLYGSEDGKSYKALDSGKVDTAGFTEDTLYATVVKGGKPDGKTFAEPVKARYLKLVITDCLKGSKSGSTAHIRFYEVEIMGKDID